MPFLSKLPSSRRNADGRADGPVDGRPARRIPSPAALPKAVGRYFTSRSPRFLAGFLAVALCVLVMCLPSAYSVEWPGPTRDVLGTVSGSGESGDSGDSGATGKSSDSDQVIRVSGADTHRDSGKLLLVTVSANGVPGYPVTNAEVLWGWLMPDRVVMPREAVVPVGQTTEEYKKETDKEMSGSQSNAIKAAERFLESNPDVAGGVDAAKLKVEMHVDDIGGPSAGMMYTLGLIDKLTPAEETGGKTIAGTGTIDEKGKVGAIGGIRLKMLGAKRDGATWFLAPESNCDEVVGHVPSGLRDVKVATLDDAYDALVAIGQGRGDSLPHCAVETQSAKSAG